VQLETMQALARYWAGDDMRSAEQVIVEWDAPLNPDCPAGQQEVSLVSGRSRRPAAPTATCAR
jgi:hypothetical protein